MEFALKELRETIRFSCRENVVCLVGRKKIQAEIIDVSRGGARLEVARSLEVGQKILIKPKQRSRGRTPVEAVVRWQVFGETTEAGIEFLEPAGKLSRKWLRKLFPGKGKAWTQGHQQRAEVRTGCRLPVVSVDGRSEGKILDISPSGACFVQADKLEDEAQLYLCLPWDYVQVTATPVRAVRGDGGWVHSVKFSELSPSERDHLKLFVEKEIGRSDEFL
jgi:PilZ domain-containing protein